jgi:hypothetical protein
MPNEEVKARIDLLKEYLNEARAYVMDYIMNARAFVDLAKILGLINKSMSLLEEIEKDIEKSTSNRTRPRVPRKLQHD